MPSSSGLTHVAMSVPDGTLTDGFRARLLEFYGRMLGWREIESLRLPDRLTVAVGPSAYINIRERPASMVTHGYEHFGVLVRSARDLRRLWDALDNEAEDLQLQPLSTNGDGEGSFRFRYLLPMAVEAQFYARLL
jgi:catechol 2,3-dioxygenase-like lactoylglutathione lyase family enzyme